jgi:hypothetical protein
VVVVFGALCVVVAPFAPDAGGAALSVCAGAADCVLASAGGLVWLVWLVCPDGADLFSAGLLSAGLLSAGFDSAGLLSVAPPEVEPPEVEPPEEPPPDAAGAELAGACCAQASGPEKGEMTKAIAVKATIRA